MTKKELIGLIKQKADQTRIKDLSGDIIRAISDENREKPEELKKPTAFSPDKTLFSEKYADAAPRLSARKEKSTDGKRARNKNGGNISPQDKPRPTHRPVVNFMTRFIAITAAAVCLIFAIAVPARIIRREEIIEEKTNAVFSRQLLALGNVAAAFSGDDMLASSLTGAAFSGDEMLASSLTGVVLDSRGAQALQPLSDSKAEPKIYAEAKSADLNDVADLNDGEGEDNSESLDSSEDDSEEDDSEEDDSSDDGDAETDASFTDEEYRIIAINANRYLLTGNALIFGKDINARREKNTDAKFSEYKYKMSVSYYDAGSYSVSYAAFYNESAVNKSQTRIDGLLIVGDKRYLMSGETQTEGDEIKTEIEIKISDNSYLGISNETAVSENEYEYKLVTDGEVVKSASVSAETEDGRSDLEIEISENGRKSAFEFSYKTRTIECGFSDGDRETDFVVYVHGDYYIYSFESGFICKLNKT